MARLAERMLERRTTALGSSPTGQDRQPIASAGAGSQRYSPPDPGFDLAGEYALQHQPTVNLSRHGGAGRRGQPTGLPQNQTLFEVHPNLQVIPVIQAVWALGFTLSQLTGRVCAPATEDEKAG